MELSKEFKSLCINTNSQCIKESFDVDYQISLPQFLDDIEKVVKCSVVSSTVDYDISVNTLTIYGKTLISITYLNCDNLILSHIFEEEFKKSFDIKDEEDIINTQINLKTKYSSFRLINQRRIDIHQALNAQISLFVKKQTTILTNCKNAFIDDFNTSYLSVKNNGITGIEFDETFSVENNTSQIKNIINYFCWCNVEDIKIIKEKMLIKINCNSSIIYEDESSNVQKFLYTFKASKIIEIPDCNENDKCFVNVSVSSLYIKVKSNSSNELNDVELVGKLCIKYKLLECCEESFIRDSYMPHFETKLDLNTIELSMNPKYYFDDNNAQIIFDNEKMISEILDLNVKIAECEIRNSNLIAVVKLCYLYFDDNGNLSYFEGEKEYKLKLCDEDFDGEGFFNILSFDYVIKNSNSICLKINFQYSAFLYKKETLTYISNIEENGRKSLDNLPELTLYFANENETVWDIAKKFSTDSNLIIEENNLTENIISGKRVLLVPGM